MITSGYTLALLCDCAKCKHDNYYFQEKAEYVGETFAECAKQARQDGWTISRCKRYCSAQNHGQAIKE